MTARTSDFSFSQRFIFSLQSSYWKRAFAMLVKRFQFVHSPYEGNLH